MWKFKSLCFDPTKRFEVLKEEVIFGKLGRQFDAVVAAALRDPSHSLSTKC
jgi:hypothetical protein